MKKNIFLITLLMFIVSLSCICFATEDDTGFLYTNESGDLIYSGDYMYDDGSTLVDDYDDLEDIYNSNQEQQEYLESSFKDQQEYYISLYGEAPTIEKLVITEINSDLKKSYITDYSSIYLYQFQEVHVRTANGLEYPAVVILAADMYSEEKNLSPLKVGDTIYANLSLVSKDDETYSLLTHDFDDEIIAFVSIAEQDRSLGTILLVIFTVLLLLLYVGKHGTKLLIPLFVAIDLIFVVFAPFIKLELNILIVAICIALEMIILISVLKTGFNRKTLVSIISSIIVVTLVTCLAALFIYTNRLSGKITANDNLYFSVAIDNIFKETVDTRALCISIVIIVSAVISSLISSKLTDLSEKYAGTKQMIGNIIEEAKGKLSEYVMIIAILYFTFSLPLYMILSYGEVSFKQYINSDSLVTNIMYVLLAIISVLISSPITAIISNLVMGNVEVKQIEPSKTEKENVETEEAEVKEVKEVKTDVKEKNNKDKKRKK